jgi:hypothetical protein
VRGLVGRIYVRQGWLGGDRLVGDGSVSDGSGGDGSGCNRSGGDGSDGFGWGRVSREQVGREKVAANFPSFNWLGIDSEVGDALSSHHIAIVSVLNFILYIYVRVDLFIWMFILYVRPYFRMSVHPYIPHYHP